MLLTSLEILVEQVKEREKEMAQQISWEQQSHDHLNSSSFVLPHPFNNLHMGYFLCPPSNFINITFRSTFMLFIPFIISYLILREKIAGKHTQLQETMEKLKDHRGSNN